MSSNKNQTRATEKMNGRKLHKIVILASVTLWLMALILPIYTVQTTMISDSYTIYGWQGFLYAPFMGIFRPDILLVWFAHFPALIALILISFYRYKTAIFVAFAAFLLSMLALLISDIGLDTAVPIVPTIGLVVWMLSIDILLIGSIFLHRRSHNLS